MDTMCRDRADGAEAFVWSRLRPQRPSLIRLTVSSGLLGMRGSVTFGSRRASSRWRGVIASTP